MKNFYIFSWRKPTIDFGQILSEDPGVTLKGIAIDILGEAPGGIVGKIPDTVPETNSKEMYEGNLIGIPGISGNISCETFGIFMD